MPAHANDNTPQRKTTAATPLAIRLYRQRRPDDLRRYIKHGTVTAVPSWLSAEGGLPESSKPLPDRVTETRPSPDEIVTLAARDAASARDGIGPFSPVELAAAMNQRIRCSAPGVISEWRGSDGKWRPMAELFRQPKGKRRKSEEERLDDNGRHLSLRGAGGFPDLKVRKVAQTAETEVFARMRAASWVSAMGVANDNARIDIDRLGIGSRVPFTRARANVGLPQAPRCPTAIAHGAEFMSYRVHSNPRAMQGGVEGGHDLVERQTVETIDAPRIDAALGEHAKVLDLSIAGLTAREIAVKSGWGETKQAERRVIAAQDAALAALVDLEENMAA